MWGCMRGGRCRVDTGGVTAPDVYDSADHLFAVGRAEAALELLRSHLTGEPENERALRLLMLANQRLGRHDEALRWADRAVSVQPRVANSWIYRATVLLELGRDDEARTAALRAVDLAPDNWLPYYLLGRALLLGSTEPSDILAAATTALSLAPNEFAAHELLGLAHDAAGDTEAAAAAYRAALAINPNSATARSNLARTDLEAHRDEQAIRGFQAAVANDPQNTTLHENLGKSVFLPLIRQTVGLFLILLVLVAVVVNIEPPYWVRGVLALVVVGAWGVLWWVRIGRLAPAVRGQLSVPVRELWDVGVTRGVMIGLAIEALCSLAAPLVPGSRLVPDLVLGVGAVMACVVMAWTYKQWQRSGAPHPAKP